MKGPQRDRAGVHLDPDAETVLEKLSMFLFCKRRHLDISQYEITQKDAETFEMKTVMGYCHYLNRKELLHELELTQLWNERSYE